MKQRIVGIDVARAFAIIGMILVNFKIVFGDEGRVWLQSLAKLMDGKAAATFVVLAGVGLVLMTNSSIANNDHKRLQRAKVQIFKRAVFLFFIGLSYYWIWPADILHFYGIYMLISLFFLQRSLSQILTATLFFMMLFPLLLLIFNYETGWNFETYDYAGFWSLHGFFRNLLFNGFHPVVPWTSFMLFGIWYGKQDLYNDNFIKKSFWISGTVFIALQIISKTSMLVLANGEPTVLEELQLILGTSPMPPMPMYMLNGIATATCIISACILLGRKYQNTAWIHVLSDTGKLALTFYVAHVIIGMGFIEMLDIGDYGDFSLEFSIGYALIFSIICLIFASVWLKYKKFGPLEWIIRKITK